MVRIGTWIGARLLAGTLLLGGFGCREAPSSIPPGEARRLVDELYAAWSLHEPERIDAIFLDQGVYEDVAAGEVHHGKGEIKALLREAFRWAPDFQVTMSSLVLAGDTAFTEWLIEGTQTAPVGELPATGRGFRLRGASVIEFREGRIARVTDYYDMATFLRQLGATIEPPGSRPGGGEGSPGAR